MNQRAVTRGSVEINVLRSHHQKHWRTTLQSGCPVDAANACQLTIDVLGNANVAVDQQFLQLFSVNRFLLDEKVCELIQNQTIVDKTLVARL